MKTQILAKTTIGIRAFALVQYLDEDWTSPVFVIASNSDRSLEKNIYAFGAIAEATRAVSIDGGVRNRVLRGAIEAFGQPFDGYAQAVAHFKAQQPAEVKGEQE